MENLLDLTLISRIALMLFIKHVSVITGYYKTGNFEYYLSLNRGKDIATFMKK
jgi:hypothetical protein